MDDSKRREHRGEPSPLVGLGALEAAEVVPAEPDPAEEEEGVTLEELSQSYQRMLAGADSDPATGANVASSAESLDSSTAVAPQGSETGIDGGPLLGGDSTGELLNGPLGSISAEQALGPDAELDQEDAACPVTPQSIVEAILFVGRPDGGPIPAAEIAGLMRGVEASEVTACVAELNEIYAQTNRATRIVADGVGYRIQLADNVSFIRDRFYGRVRQVKLNQAAIDCLALIAYQPGISRDKLEQQRGQPSGSLLAQLIRRQLIEVRRVTEEKKQVQRYYPTHRLLDLTGIESLDDLPQTEDLE